MKVVTQSFQLLIGSVLFLSALNVHAQGGATGVGGGGDFCDGRIDEIRRDLQTWIQNGGSSGLDLRAAQLTVDTYNSKMLAILSDHAVVLACLKPTEANPVPVQVGGVPKTCRGYVSLHDQRPHIDCDLSRFYRNPRFSDSEQYALIHHEFAGLQSIEKNVGGSSDYSISNQLVEYLVAETVFKLGIKKQKAETPRHILATYTDHYNDDDLRAECLVYSDGTGMLMFSNIVPFYKPTTFTLRQDDFKQLNALLSIEALGKLDSKTGKCSESVSPFEILGKTEGADVYVSGEAQEEFFSQAPYCWVRKNRDHVELSQKSRTAALMKTVCGFFDQ